MHARARRPPPLLLLLLHHRCALCALVDQYVYEMVLLNLKYLLYTLEAALEWHSQSPLRSLVVWKFEDILYAVFKRL